VHTIKQLNLEKNSFTLFETLLSVVILSIVVASFYKLSTSYNDQNIYNQYQNHNTSQTIKYFDFTYSPSNISKIIINNNIKYKKIVYNTQDIYLEKYTLELK